jgi:hypothetical protein
MQKQIDKLNAQQTPNACKCGHGNGLHHFYLNIPQSVKCQQCDCRTFKPQPTPEVWQECWVDGRQDFYLISDGLCFIKGIYDRMSQDEFDKQYNLYPDITDGKVHTWEMEGIGKVVFAFAGNDEVMFRATQDVAGIIYRDDYLLSVAEFQQTYTKLQDYKYANQKPALKYEVVWTEIKAPETTVGFIALENDVERYCVETMMTQKLATARWFEHLNLKFWECEVREI